MHQIEVSLVFIGVLREDEDVIDIHPCKNPQAFSKNFIDDALECRWCIAEAEGHNDPFEGPKLRVEGSCFDIFVVDSNLVQPTDKLDLLKDRRAPQCTEYGLERR